MSFNYPDFGLFIEPGRETRGRHAVRDVVARFRAQVQAMPDHPAVVQAKRTVTYGALGAQAARIAAALAAVCEHPRVLVYLPKGADAYAAMFGTLMAGGYYSPVNLDAPVHRHAEILRQFRPHAVLSTRELIAYLPLAEVGAEFIDADNLPPDELPQPLPAHDLAYVIFTSGSTGEPKGVMIPRTALAHYAHWAIRDMQVSPADRWSQHPNIGFDLSVLDIYGALCGGATLFPLETPRDKLLPADFIKRNRLTIWDSVPSVIDLMIKARQVTRDRFASLRLLTFCGEPLYQRHLDAIFAAHENVTVHNTYGPTEATVSCSLVRLRADNYREYCDNSVALGQPIPGMEFRLEGGTAAEGELVLLGEQLAAGYWRNESETGRAFLTMHDGGAPRRAYRTGDWIVQRGGEYYFVARMDTQVKIRGNRVELDEIDSAIHALGYGNSCTVFVDGRLHSFLETRQLPALADVREALATRLPDYELPDDVHAVGTFPRNANDKVDRARLAEKIREQQERKK